MKQPALGQISVVMLGVSDLSKSVEFYKTQLNLELMMEEPQLAFLKAGSISIGLSKGLASHSDHIAGATEVVFSVESVTECFKVFSLKGIRFINEPRPVTDTDWATTFLDPDGHKLTVFGKK